jgi:predicted hydrolase (HD superfamily)
MKSLLLEDYSLLGKLNKFMIKHKKEAEKMSYTYFVCYSYSYSYVTDKLRTELKGTTIDLDYEVTKDTFEKFTDDVYTYVRKYSAKTDSLTIINWKLLK